MNTEAPSNLAFLATPEEAPAIEIHINFGIFAGRTVMLSEIDRLAGWLLDEVENVTVIAEDRHQIGRSERRIRAPGQGRDRRSRCSHRSDAQRALESRLLERIDYWVRLCIAEGHGDL